MITVIISNAKAKENAMSIAHNLRRIREKKGFTKKRLASESGLAEATITLIELDSITPSFYELNRLAKALGAHTSSGFFQPCPDLPADAGDKPARDGRAGGHGAHGCRSCQCGHKAEGHARPELTVNQGI